MSIRTALTAVALLACVPPLVADATCSFDLDGYDRALEGHCREVGKQRFVVEYRADGDPEPIYTLQWPGEHGDPTPMSCPKLCEAGAMLLLDSADGSRLAESLAGQSAAATGSCESHEEWNTENCEQESSFRCHGACGVGCKSCEVEQVADLCGWMCEPIVLHCYSRPCCAEHDDCLSAAQTPEEEVECHAEAVANGCGLADANGETGDAPDAEEMDFEVCVSIFQPECELSVEISEPFERR